MKRTKMYCAILLIVCTLCATTFTAMAASAEFAMNWLVNFENGVDGYIYAPTPYGFIVQNYEADPSTSALVDASGVVIPPTTNNFSLISDTGLIPFFNDSYLIGVMDKKENIIINAEYSSLFILNENRFLVSKTQENEMGYYIDETGIIDINGNEIVPIGKYNFDSEHLYCDFYQNFKLYDENENIAIIDCDGNFLVDFDEGLDARPLSVADKYLVYDEANNKSYIRNKDGSTVAEIDGEAFFAPYNYIEVSEEDENYNLTVYEYDFDGKLLNTIDYGNMGRPYTYKDIYAKPARYTWETEYIDNGLGNAVVVDTLTDSTYDFNNVGFDIIEVYDNGLMKVCSYSTYQTGLMTLGNEMILPFEYDNIEYCKELDLFAVERENKVAVAKITPIRVNVLGKELIFDQNPINKDGRTLVPLRAIFEALGATVDWNGETQTITSTLNSTNIQLTINSNKMYVDGNEVILDVPATILNGRTLVPVRAISEAFGCNVDWDGATRTVIITK